MEWKKLRVSESKNVQRTKYLLKNTAIFSIGSFASKFLSFLLIPLYTSVLNSAEYGMGDLVHTTVNLLNMVFTLCIAESVMRFTMQTDIRKTSPFYIGLSLVILSNLLVIFLAVPVSLLAQGSEYLFLLPYILVLYAVSSMETLLSGLMRGLEKTKWIAIAGVVSTIVMITSNIFLLINLRMGVHGYIVSAILAQFSSVCIYSIGGKAYRYIRKERFNNELLRSMLAYSIPIVFAQLGWWINSSTNRYLIAFFLGNDEVGLYSVAMRIPTILVTVTTVFIQAWKLSAIKESSEKDFLFFFDKMFNHFSMLILLVGGLIILLSQPLGAFLFRGTFTSAWVVSPLLSFAAIFNGLSAFIGAFFNAKTKTRPLLYSTLIGAFINVSLSCLLIGKIGVIGVAIASLCGDFSIFFIRRSQIEKNIGQSFGFSKRMTVMYGLVFIMTILVTLQLPAGTYMLCIAIFLVIVSFAYNDLKPLRHFLIHWWRNQRSR